jgi:leader peptidase (prepilin peptidase)/N-methyltransferase
MKVFLGLYMSNSLALLQSNYTPYILAIIGFIVSPIVNLLIHNIPQKVYYTWINEAGDRESNINPKWYTPIIKSHSSHSTKLPIFGWFISKNDELSHGRKLIYASVEFIIPAATFATACYMGSSLNTLYVIILMWLMVALFFIDLEHMLLPDLITKPLLAITLILSAIGIGIPLYESIIGAVFVYGFLFSIMIAYKAYSGLDGMGYGDFKLLAIFGAILGLKGVAVVIMLSVMLGAVISLPLMLKKSDGRHLEVPFGPSIIISGLACIIFESSLLQYFSSLLFK